MTRVSILAVALLFLESRALAAPSGDFRDGTAALEKGEVELALRHFESLADRGERDANASFNRGLAYLRRSESPTKRVGDLGQAAAAFVETLELDPTDAQAELLLEEARIRIARDKRASGGRPTVEVTPLSARVLGFLSVPLLVGLCAAGSLLASLGFALFLRRASSARRTAQVLVASGIALLGASFALAIAKAHHDRDRTLAVVVATRTALLDEAGRPRREHEPLSEGTTVEVVERRGRLCRIATEFGSDWVELASLRLISSD